MGLLSTYPASTTEGRLISTPDAEAGSGGRPGALEMRRRFPQPAVQAASSWRAAARMGFLTAGRSNAFCQSNADRDAWPRGGGSLAPLIGCEDERVAHPGQRGANLTNTARGAPGIRQFRGDLLV